MHFMTIELVSLRASFGVIVRLLHFDSEVIGLNCRNSL
uniref:Uncharacterized protein n=1 Tax=Rhizophora mucronata TaxID=61149 RepID=A0A2P2PN76_RHIMU